MSDEGELIAGRYRLVARIGRGAMGEVWQARDERLDRVVAVKRLAPCAESGAAAADRAMREARVAARLRHPHAITVHDVVDHDGLPQLVMEYLPSESLAAILHSGRTLPERSVAAIGAQVASALEAAHAEGIVHRDITPGNILIAPDGTAKLADFGISRAAGESTVTGAGYIAGTPAYLAPEVVCGEEAGFPSDVFSLGATLYRALEGKPPFGTGKNAMDLLRRAAREEVGRPAHPGPLSDVLLALLRRNPADRPVISRARELLGAVAGGNPVPGPPPREDTRVLPVRRRWHRAAVLVACAMALLASGVLIGGRLGHGTPGARAATPIPPRPSASAQAGCDARYEVTDSWPGGYQALVTVRGEDGANLTGWAVSWALPAGHRIGTLWNGTLAQRGTEVRVTSARWNAVVRPAGTTSFGLIGLTRGDRAAPPVLTCRAL
ncbi:serine/threonine-protein kinase [Amycolatopsis sp. NPDC059021]|uniref:serine/threonine-protein kinase n=1 Tax=Amycolatopsis sp. NPDC059021 TaxID=3346704 RepID=UPI00366A60EE